jgi:hypothetical protein
VSVSNIATITSKDISHKKAQNIQKHHVYFCASLWLLIAFAAAVSGEHAEAVLIFSRVEEIAD